MMSSRRTEYIEIVHNGMKLKFPIHSIIESAEEENIDEEKAVKEEFILKFEKFYDES